MGNGWRAIEPQNEIILFMVLVLPDRCNYCGFASLCILAREVE